MASKHIISYLNKCDKLNGGNYKTWRHKILYVLEDYDTLEGISHMIEEPKYGSGYSTSNRLGNLPVIEKERFHYSSYLGKFFGR